MGLRNCKIRLSFRLVHAFLLVTFVSGQILPPSVALAQSSSILNLPLPGAMVGISPNYVPIAVKGIKVFPDNPFRFDFILDTGNSQLDPQQLNDETKLLIKYFLTALTIPDNDQWVNLSPFENDRIVPNEFGITEMGRDLLAQDYLLKQLTASLVYPEHELGKRFWENVYRKAYEKYGDVDIPMSTFNKVWILPEYAKVYEYGSTAVITESRLRVLLEEDYVALVNQKTSAESLSSDKDLALSQNTKDDRRKTMDENVPHPSSIVLHGEDVNNLGSQIVREIVLPEIEREINEGKNFAKLRQIYRSMIMAAWYKRKLKDGILGKMYVGANKVAGVDVADKQIKQKIYDQYLAAFKKGVYNYIREDVDVKTQEVIPRKYFSGGVVAGLEVDRTTEIFPVDQQVQTAAAADTVGEAKTASVILDPIDGTGTVVGVTGVGQQVRIDGENDQQQLTEKPDLLKTSIAENAIKILNSLGIRENANVVSIGPYLNLWGRSRQVPWEVIFASRGDKVVIYQPDNRLIPNLKLFDGKVGFGFIKNIDYQERLFNGDSLEKGTQDVAILMSVLSSPTVSFAEKVQLLKNVMGALKDGGLIIVGSFWSAEDKQETENVIAELYYEGYPEILERVVSEQDGGDHRWMVYRVNKDGSKVNDGTGAVPQKSNSSGGALKQIGVLGKEQSVGVAKEKLDRWGQLAESENLQQREIKGETYNAKIVTSELDDASSGEMPEGLFAYHLRDTQGNLIIVLSGDLTADEIDEAVYHEFREDYWERELAARAERGELSAEDQARISWIAHVLASAEESVAFGQDMDEITAYHTRQIRSLENRQLRELINEQRQAHQQVISRYLTRQQFEKYLVYEKRMRAELQSALSARRSVDKLNIEVPVFEGIDRKVFFDPQKRLEQIDSIRRLTVAKFKKAFLATGETEGAIAYEIGRLAGAAVDSIMEGLQGSYGDQAKQEAYLRDAKVTLSYERDDATGKFEVKLSDNGAGMSTEVLDRLRGFYPDPADPQKKFLGESAYGVIQGLIGGAMSYNQWEVVAVVSKTEGDRDAKRFAAGLSGQATLNDYYADMERGTEITITGRSLNWLLKKGSVLSREFQDGKKMTFLADGSQFAERNEERQGMILELPAERFGTTVNLGAILEEAAMESLGYVPLFSVFGSYTYARTDQGLPDWQYIDDLDIRIHTQKKLTFKQYVDFKVRLFKRLAQEEGLQVHSPDIDDPTKAGFTQPRWGIMDRQSGNILQLQIQFGGLDELFAGTESFMSYRVTDQFFGDVSFLDVITENFSVRELLRPTVRFYKETLSGLRNEMNDSGVFDVLLPGWLKTLYQLAVMRGKGEGFRWLISEFDRFHDQNKNKVFDRVEFNRVLERALAELDVAEQVLFLDFSIVYEQGMRKGNSSRSQVGNLQSGMEQESDALGGIDMNQNALDLRTEGQAIRFDMPFDPKKWENIQFDGLTPVILQINTTNIPLFIGANQADETIQLGSA